MKANDFNVLMSVCPAPNKRLDVSDPNPGLSQAYAARHRTRWSTCITDRDATTEDWTSHRTPDAGSRVTVDIAGQMSLDKHPGPK